MNISVEKSGVFKLQKLPILSHKVALPKHAFQWLSLTTLGAFVII
jgi:hypothetical protein